MLSSQVVAPLKLSTPQLDSELVKLHSLLVVSPSLHQRAQCQILRSSQDARRTNERTDLVSDAVPLALLLLDHTRIERVLKRVIRDGSVGTFGLLRRARGRVERAAFGSHGEYGKAMREGVEVSSTIRALDP